MNKIKKIVLLSISLLLIAGIVNASFVYQYGSFQERALKAVECGIVTDISEYKGSLTQNLSLLSCYEEQDILTLGGTGQRPSDFKTTLAESLTSSASTTEEILLSSVVTADGHTLTSLDVGDFICLKINPSSSNKELVCCTGGIDGNNFVNCTRGYNFYDGNVSTANVKVHSPGETVTISNDDIHLKTQYLSNDDDETIYGLYTYASSTLTKPYFRIGNTTFGDISYNETLNQLEYRNNAGSWTAIGGGSSTYTGLAPITVSSNIVSLATTSNNYDFNLSAGKFIIRKNSSITSNADGLAVATTADFNFTGTFKLGGVTLSGIGATASGTALTNLTSGSTTDASYWHTHTVQKAYYSTSTFSKAIGTSNVLLLSKTIKGGDMGDNGILRVRVYGGCPVDNWGNVVFKFGGVTIGTSSPCGYATDGRSGYSADVDIYNQNSQNSQFAAMKFFTKYSSDFALTDFNGTNVTTTPMTINTTQDQAFEIWGKTLGATSFVTVSSTDIQLIK